MRLFLFELKKFLTNKKNLILFVVFSVLLLGGRLQQELQSNETTNYKQIEVQIAQSNLKTFTEVLKNADRYKLSQEDKQKYQNDIILREKMLAALKNDEVNKYFDLVYEDDKARLKALEETTQPHLAYTDPEMTHSYWVDDREPIKQDMRYIETVKSRGLKFEYMPSAQVHAFGKLVQQGLTQIFYGLWLLGFAVILSVNLASLFENKEDRVYRSLAIKKSNIICTKMLSSIAVTYIWICLLALAFLVIVGLINGFGSPNYPAYLMNIPSRELAETGAAQLNIANMTISNGQVILTALLYTPVVLLFLSSLGMFFSVLTRKSMIVIAAIAVLLLGYQNVEGKLWIQSFRKFIPMSYTNPIELLKNPDALFGKYSLIVGVFYLLSMSFVLIFITNILFKKYRIRKI
ncbi:MAG: hypothetical protein LBV19_06745 [Streptococcaceae bacterium]|jgi:ABC-2 type transport system permease protein|nr:hypothetical protein [Streptococcaceae bacterium]